MLCNKKKGSMLGRRSICLAIGLVFGSHVALAADGVPPGYHQMPDGRIMANNPATAIAPPGYFLRKNGTLVKVEVEQTQTATPTPAPQAPTEQKSPQVEGVPPGFHQMPDGTIMANNPATAVAPPGYHLMPNGVLMSNSGNPPGAVDVAGHVHQHHHHGSGSMMFEYRYMRMHMGGLLDTTKSVTTDELIDPQGQYGFMMAPTVMDMNMHMLMGMYGFTEYLTGMVMGHFLHNTMGMKASDTTESTMSSAGLGDTILSVAARTPYLVTFGLGVSLPTGSINKKGDMSMSATQPMTDVQLPYAMQLGSGSYELKPSLSYNDSGMGLSWGAQFEYTARLNTNSNQYKLGNRINMNSWIEWQVIRFLSLSARLDGNSWKPIKGADPSINQTMSMDMGDGTMMDMKSSPTADPDLYGGLRLDGKLGVKGHTADKMFGSKLELSYPLYQNLWGPQMKNSWTVSIGLETMF